MRRALVLLVLLALGGCNRKIAECGKLVDSMELAREQVSSASSRGADATKKALASARRDVSALRLGDATLTQDRADYLRVLDEIEAKRSDDAQRDEARVVDAINGYCGGR